VQLSAEDKKKTGGGGERQKPGKKRAALKRINYKTAAERHKNRKMTWNKSILLIW
jgi:hypothetical protein